MLKKNLINIIKGNGNKWVWFIGLYALSVTLYASIQYSSHWLIHQVMMFGR